MEDLKDCHFRAEPVLHLLVKHNNKKVPSVLAGRSAQALAAQLRLRYASLAQDYFASAHLAEQHCSEGAGLDVSCAMRLARLVYGTTYVELWLDGL